MAQGHHTHLRLGSQKIYIAVILLFPKAFFVKVTASDSLGGTLF